MVEYCRVRIPVPVLAPEEVLEMLRVPVRGREVRVPRGRVQAHTNTRSRVVVPELAQILGRKVVVVAVAVVVVAANIIVVEA